MKKIYPLIIFVLSVKLVFTQSLTINSDKSIIEFNYVSEGAVGTINGVTGKINFDLSNLSNTSFEANANIKSINTSNKTRDKHLNAPDYFDTEKYPAISFKSDSITNSEDEFTLYGKFTIKDITKEEKISFTFEENIFNGRCVIFSNDYKIKTQKKREDSKILIKISVPII